MRTTVDMRPARVGLIAAAFITATADATSTWVGIHQGHHELNGIAADLIHVFGLTVLCGLRVAVPVGLFAGLLYATRNDRIIYRCAYGAVLIAVMLWAVVATRNVAITF